jgi:hypothetical protein
MKRKEIKIRKTWGLNPATKVEQQVKGKKPYKRKEKHKKPLY